MASETITNLRGDHERISLPTPIWEGSTETGTGCWTTGIFRGPRTKRMFLRTHSIWQRPGTQETYGTRTREIDESEFLAACERVGADPVGIEPTLV